MGPVAPFDAAALVLLVGGAIVISSWSENFGDPSDKGSLGETLQKAAKAIYADPKITLLGIMQSLFEGSMYTFVFLVRAFAIQFMNICDTQCHFLPGTVCCKRARRRHNQFGLLFCLLEMRTPECASCDLADAEHCRCFRLFAWF